jgi:hypothetical protein
MKITRESPVTKAINEREIDITPEQYARWESGVFIQTVAPHLSADDREFIISGCTPEDWNTLFPPEEEEKQL